MSRAICILLFAAALLTVSANLKVMANATTSEKVEGVDQFDRINIHPVERIEVLKGPASVLYGSNACSGAVNIVLKAAKNEDGEVFPDTGDGCAFTGGGFYGVHKGDLKLNVWAGLFDEKALEFEWTHSNDKHKTRGW
jgi:outer membrane cobalamin receptor